MTTPTNDTPWWDQPKEEETPWWDTPKEPEIPWWDSSDKKSIYNEGKSNETTTEIAANPLLEPDTDEIIMEQENTKNDTQETSPSALKQNLKQITNSALNWCHHNIHAIVYTLIGLLCGLGILNIGFWKTFLIALCLGTGYVLGSVQDGNPHLMQKIKNFSRKFLDNNPFFHKD